MSKPQDLLRPERLGKLNKFIHLLGSRTRYATSCSNSSSLFWKSSENNARTMWAKCRYFFNTTAGAVYRNICSSNGWALKRCAIYRTILFNACSLLPSAGVHWNHFHSCSFTCGHFHRWVIVKVKSQSETICKRFLAAQCLCGTQRSAASNKYLNCCKW
jgi:hypothetical protein